MAFHVHNNEELRTAYGLLRVFERSASGSEFNALIADLKKEIRFFNNRPESANVIVCDYGIDGCLMRQELPEGIESLEEAESYFHDALRIPMRYSAYDCSGQLFTAYSKVFNRNGRWMAYHRVACDC